MISLIDSLAIYCFNSTFWLTILVISISFALYIQYSFTFWSQQGIPNAPWHIIQSFKKPMHQIDAEYFEKYGKVFG
jgi:hypothetical protein